MHLRRFKPAERRLSIPAAYASAYDWVARLPSAMLYKCHLLCLGPYGPKTICRVFVWAMCRVVRTADHPQLFLKYSMLREINIETT